MWVWGMSTEAYFPLQNNSAYSHWLSRVPNLITWEKIWIENVAATAAKSLQSCPTVRSHRRKPTRLPHPWDSPGKKMLREYIIDWFHHSKNLRVTSLEQSDFKRIAFWCNSVNFLAGIICCWVIELINFYICLFNSILLSSISCFCIKISDQ